MMSVYCVCDFCEFYFFFFFKQKTAYEMLISDWSSDVCSSDLGFAMQEVEAGRNIAYGQVMQGVGHQVPDPQAHDTQYQHLINQGAKARKIGRASCRERVCQYV